MPGYTPNLSLPYPLYNETVTAQSWQDLATAVDNQCTVIESLFEANILRPTAAAIGNSPTGTTGSFQIVNFTTGEWAAPSSFHNPSSNPDQFIAPTSGLYYAAATAAPNGPATTTTALSASFTVNGFSFFQQTKDWHANNAAFISIKGLLALNAGDIVRVGVVWNGTGGPNSFVATMALFMMALL